VDVEVKAKYFKILRELGISGDLEVKLGFPKRMRFEAQRTPLLKILET